nr:O-antigen ligase family protein [uncultured Trichococcus sp.]
MSDISVDSKISTYSIILTTLVVFNAEYHNSLVSLVITALALFGLKNPIAIIPTFFLTSLSTDYFVAFPGIGFTRILSLILALSFIFSNRQLILRKKWIIELMVIFTATTIAFLFSFYRDVNGLLSMGINILIFIIFANIKFSEMELKEVLKNIFYSIIIMIGFFCIQFISNPNILNNGRLTINENVNENRFAMMFGQLVAYSFGYMIIVKNKLDKILSVIIITLGCYFILLSGSRSAFVGVLFGVTIAVVLLALKNKKQKKLVFLLLIFGLSGYLLFEYLVSTNPLLLYRFNLNQVVSSGGTRRWPRAETEIKHVIPNNFIFGVGLSSRNEYIATSKYMSDPGSSHNFIISMLTQIGIVGFLAYMNFYYKVIKNLVNSVKFNVIHIIPLMLILTAIFNGIGEVMYSERLFWNGLSLAALSLSTLERKNN